MTMPIREFPNFEALAKAHVEGRDFNRIIRPVKGSKVAVISPHGGTIEPRTDDIASVLAGEDFSLYAFISHLPTRLANLHITSHRFDDPACLAVVAQHVHVIAVHGCAKQGEAILIGGLDTDLASELATEARTIGVETHTDGQCLAGTHPLNICNRGEMGSGVQLELTMALRRSSILKPLLTVFRTVLLRHQNAA